MPLPTGKYHSGLMGGGRVGGESELTQQAVASTSVSFALYLRDCPPNLI